MKKKMLAVLLSAVVAVTTLAGCGNSSDNVSEGTTETDAAGTTEKTPGGGVLRRVRKQQ